MNAEQIEHASTATQECQPDGEGLRIALFADGGMLKYTMRGPGPFGRRGPDGEWEQAAATLSWPMSPAEVEREIRDQAWIGELAPPTPAVSDDLLQPIPTPGTE